MTLSIPPVPARENYHTLRLLSNVLEIVGWTNLVCSIPLAATILISLYNVINFLFADMIYEQGGSGITNILSGTLATIPAMIILSCFIILGIASLAGAEMLKLMVNIHYEQHYASQLLYLVSNRLYERYK